MLEHGKLRCANLGGNSGSFVLYRGLSEVLVNARGEQAALRRLVLGSLIVLVARRRRRNLRGAARQNNARKGALDCPARQSNCQYDREYPKRSH